MTRLTSVSLNSRLKGLSRTCIESDKEEEEEVTKGIGGRRVHTQRVTLRQGWLTSTHTSSIACTALMLPLPLRSFRLWSLLWVITAGGTNVVTAEAEVMGRKYVVV